MVSTKELHIALLNKVTEVCSCAVWDKVPQGATYPYAVLNSVTVNNADALNAARQDRMIYLSIFSDAAGQVEVMGILEEIETLHNGTLSLSGGNVCSMRVTHSDTNRDADGVTYTGRATLRILTTD